MSDATANDVKPNDAVAPAAGAAAEAKLSEAEVPAQGEVAPTEVSSAAAAAPAPEAASEAVESSDKPAAKETIAMKDASPPAKSEAMEPVEAAPAATTVTDDSAAAAAEEADVSAVATATPSAAEKKTPLARRKSMGASSAKKLSKKSSKAKLTHIDAKPGDLFLVKLRGFPEWPVIVADESMLPSVLLKSRPVSAARSDGTYREDYTDGGKRAGDRAFPVMYLSTNEFSWVLNYELKDLAPEDAEGHINGKMRKDLTEAFILAGQNHPLEHYKSELQQFQEEQLRKAEAALQAKKGRKGKNAAPPVEEADGEDVEMADAPVVEEETPVKEKKQKKRKAEEPAETPQRSDSVKKPKIKLNTSSTPKAANGVSTPKSGKEQSAPSKAAKPKTKKAPKDKDGEEKKEKEVVPKEPELTSEEKHQRKEKEVLFLRHKLQKGLLTRDQEPKEEEMKLMSDYITKLEGFPDLEVAIIRATKINKVLKAILKLDSIPKEEEFNFKNRSQTLLDKWNKLLASDATPANGVNGDAAPKEEPATNGVKSKDKPKEEAKESIKAEKPAEPAEAEKPATEVEAPAAVESAA